MANKFNTLDDAYNAGSFMNMKGLREKERALKSWIKANAADDDAFEKLEEVQELIAQAKYENKA